MLCFGLVSQHMVEMQKQLNIIKVDIVKNQEILAEIVERSRGQLHSHMMNEVSFDSSDLKIPVTTIEELNNLEANEELKKILVNSYYNFKKTVILTCIDFQQAYVLRRHGKSYDAKRTTYHMLKLVVDNRVAEKINMEGRRGDKIAFGHYTISKIIIGTE